MAKRILVVEDEAPIREMLCFVLEQKGYETVEAEDYADGLAKVREPYPELIVLDWMMPGGSGIQFIKQLKQDEVTRQIPVVMLTARGEEEDKVRGLEAGAADAAFAGDEAGRIVAGLQHDLVVAGRAVGRSRRTGGGSACR